METQEIEDNDLIKENKILDMELDEEKEYSNIKKFLAEFIGTTCLAVSLQLLNLIYRDYISTDGPLILVSMIYLFGKVSGGHFNPAVSIPMCIRKKITLSQCFYYIGAQILGSFVGNIVAGLISIKSLSISHIKNNTYDYYDYDYDYDRNNSTKITAWSYVSCFIYEMISTFILVLIIFGSYTKENKNVSGIFIGLTYYTLCSINSMISDDSFNPAISLASHVVLAIGYQNEYFVQIWLFIIAPIIGGIAGGFAFMLFEDEY